MTTDVIRPSRRPPVAPELAYILPMGVFLAGIQITSWWPGLFAPMYAIKTIVVAAIIAFCWPAYTRIDWRAWPWGVLVGVLGIVEWVGGDKLLLHLLPNYPRLHPDTYDPYVSIASPHWRMAFFVVRWAGPTLVVPLMEELFWRDYLWRTIIAPNDFRLAAVGEWDAKAFVIVTLFFSSVHVQWVVAIGWGLMIGLLLVRTKSLGACIVAHCMTNLLLGGYVLWTHDWYYW